MKLKFLISSLILLLTQAFAETHSSRAPSKNIFFEISGPQSDLKEELKKAFKNKIDEKSCWRVSDFGMKTSNLENLCARFLPYTSDKKLKWSKDVNRQDLLLKLEIFEAKSEYGYKKRFFCPDGKKMYSCANMGTFNFKRDNQDELTVLMSDLFRTGTILGIK